MQRYFFGQFSYLDYLDVVVFTGRFSADFYDGLEFNMFCVNFCHFARLIGDEEEEERGYRRVEEEQEGGDTPQEAQCA